MNANLLQPVSPVLPTDRSDIENLLDAAFGQDRRQKTAYRLRDGSAPLDTLGFVVRRDDDHLCGSIEFWPVDLVDDVTGNRSPAVLLGPIAVAEGCRGQGLGGTLIRAGIEAARANGHQTIILVGDPEYYGRFGFTDVATKGWSLPGPYEQRRLLAIAGANAPQAAMIQRSLAFAEPDESSKTCA
jgi:predicted N-acetyltransferase YhbS